MKSKSQHVPFRRRGRIKAGGAEGEEAAPLARSPLPPSRRREGGVSAGVADARAHGGIRAAAAGVGGVRGIAT